MHTEADFQDALDLDINNWQLRLVFADWLQEQGDSRAAGYRALGRLRLYPLNERSCRLFCFLNDRASPEHAQHILPTNWQEALLSMCNATTTGMVMDWFSRQKAEDTVALAFLLLPPERQQELMGH